MTSRMKQNEKQDRKPGEDENDPALLKIARKIAPPSQETSDAELIDPGANIPDIPLGRHKPKQKPPSWKTGGK
ncbi:MAG TPA: hypothetical protein VEC06_16110 [Paucimonas sp.]|nr:hypothetical protein [Paucimonas sp.]